MVLYINKKYFSILNESHLYEKALGVLFWKREKVLFRQLCVAYFICFFVFFTYMEACIIYFSITKYLFCMEEIKHGSTL